MSEATYLNHLADNLTTTSGVDNVYGQNDGEFGKTTEEADEIYIGYKKTDSNGNLVKSIWDGDFERDYQDTDQVFTLDTAGGDDYVRIRDDQNAYTVATLGAGDDIYHINDALDSDLKDTLEGNEDARAYVLTEEGDDAVYVGGHIDGGRIFTGSGSDNVVVEGEVDDGAVIDLGSGNTEYANGHDEANSADEFDAVNNLRIGGGLGESSDYDYGMVLGGEGQDNVEIAGAIEGKSVISLGKNIDTVSVHHMQHDSQILTDSGDDVVTVTNSLFDNSVIDTSGEIIEGRDAIEGQPEREEWVYDPDQDMWVLEIIPAVEAQDAVETQTDDDIVKVGYSTLDHSTIITGEGDDFIEIADDVDDSSSIFAGDHDDVLIVHDDVENKASIDMGNGDNIVEIGSQVGGLSTITAYEGNDVLNVGYAIATQSTVNLGNGDNTITTGDDIDDQAKVITGSGNDTLVVGDDVENSAVIDLGEGNNNISVASQFGGNAMLTTGTGDDSLEIGYALAGSANIDLGEGNNKVTIGDDADGYSSLSTGNGDDVLNIGDDVEDGAVINLGHGNNQITISDDVEDLSSITTGSGNDVLNIGDSVFNSATIDLGAGNDTVTVGGGLFHASQISGGEGSDSLTFTYAEDDRQVEGMTFFTGMSTSNFTGFESVALNGNNTLDVLFEDLVNDESRDGALYITGSDSSKVDLGDTNWNSDDASQAKFDDHTGGSWSKADNSFVDVNDGTVYDVYQNSLDTSGANLVYIEQGITVI